LFLQTLNLHPNKQKHKNKKYIFFLLQEKGGKKNRKKETKQGEKNLLQMS
jgi:hypothetical protein